MFPFFKNAMWPWAALAVGRRPFSALLSGLALAAIVMLTGIALLLPRSMADTTAAMLERAPDLVVRRVGPGGWMPMPASEAAAHALAVRGVTTAQPRVWGVMAGANGPVTVWGMTAIPPEIKAAIEWNMTKPGTDWQGNVAIVGGGVADLPGQWGGGPPPRVLGRLPHGFDMATHDLVLMPADAARRLLTLPEGHAGDLAVTVFHPEEAEALRPDLADAFPWPVQIATRSEALGRGRTRAGQAGALAALALIPAVLGLCLLAAATVREGMGRRGEAGLLKALGWSTMDIVRLHLYQGLIIALPGLAAGMALAYGALFRPGARWPAALMAGLTGPIGSAAPHLRLHPSGAAWALLEMAALVMLPYLMAILWPALRLASTPPASDMETIHGV